MDSTIRMYVVITAVWILYSGQAVWARYLAADAGAAKQLNSMNGWLGVGLGGLVVATLGGIVAMYLSKGRIGTSVSGIAWTGPQPHAGLAFSVCGLLALAVLTFIRVRFPAGSLGSDVLIFLGPGLTGLIPAFLWGSVLYDVWTR